MMQILEQTANTLRVRFPKSSGVADVVWSFRSRLLVFIGLLAFTAGLLLLASWRIPQVSMLRCDHDGRTGVACRIERQHLYGTRVQHFERGRVAAVQRVLTNSEDDVYRLKLLDRAGEEVGRMRADERTDPASITALIQQGRPGTAEVRLEETALLRTLGLAALGMLLGSLIGLMRGPTNREVAEIAIDQDRKRFRCLLTDHRTGSRRTTELEWDTVRAAEWAQMSESGGAAQYGVTLVDAESNGVSVGPLRSRAEAAELLALLRQYGFDDGSSRTAA